MSRFIELEDEEFDLLCMAVESAVDSHRRAADEKTGMQFEDERMDEMVFQGKYERLQEKFPEPGAIRLVDPE